MSKKYDEYLAEHRANVEKGCRWLCENVLTDMFPHTCFYIDGKQYESSKVSAWATYNVFCDIDIKEHDASKNSVIEYDAYDAHFYGNNKSYAVVQGFKYAWLHHIHHNPHHWDYWVLLNDDVSDGETALEMPMGFVVEMICDWWAFSWKNGDLTEIFSWYEEHKEYIRLHPKTKKIVEDILNKMHKTISEKKVEQ